MADDYRPGWMNVLWRQKFLIILALGVIILAVSTYNYYELSNARAADLEKKTSEYDALDTMYRNLSDEHVALILSNNNLTERYNNLTDMYSLLSSNQSALQSDYDELKAGVDRLQEKGGPAIAVRYTTYKGGTKEDPKRIVTATVYNVGNNKASRVTLKCRVIFDNQPSVNEQTFTNIAPMDKVSYTWEFSILADVESVWAEGS